MTSDLAMSVFDDDRLIGLAREVAMDIQPIEVTLERYGVSAAEWERLRHNRRFDEYLKDAVTTWQSALNSGERIKVKSLAVIEQWLLNAYGELNGTANLRDKTELAKLIARLAGVGEKATDAMATGEKISITINMGDTSVRTEKVVGPKVIEGELSDGN